MRRSLQSTVERNANHNMQREHWFKSIRLLLLIFAMLLSACTDGEQKEETPPTKTATGTPAGTQNTPVPIVVTATPPMPATNTPRIIVVTATPLPSTPTPTNTPLPTDTPTPTPDLIEQRVLDLIGWDGSVAANSDLNGDGKTEVVIYRKTRVTPVASVPGYSLVASELVVAQEGIGDNIRLLLEVSKTGVKADGAVIFSFSSPAEALLIARTGAQISVIPLDGEGRGCSKGGTFAWDPGGKNYTLMGEVEIPEVLLPELPGTPEIPELPTEIPREIPYPY